MSMFLFDIKKMLQSSTSYPMVEIFSNSIFPIDIFAIAVLTFYYSDTGTAMFSDPALVCERIMVASCVDVEVCLLTP